MSINSEYYAAKYDEGPYEIIAATSFGLCFAVFLGALILVWRKAPEALRRQAALPFESPAEVSRDRG